MQYVKVLGLIAFAAALLAFTGTATATELTSSSGAMVTPFTDFESASEGHAVLDSNIGEVKCNSEITGSNLNTGGSAETVTWVITDLNFIGCTDGARVETRFVGDLEIHTQGFDTNKNGTLTSTGTEVTVELFGAHCIFGTTRGPVDIGTLTGSATTGGRATLDISASIPRVGGRSGAFCGSSSPWTGSYIVETPAVLNVD
jgi:hypothetical protein